MAERNIEKIKRLQKDLGRYVKKVQDQDKIIKKLGVELGHYEKGVSDLQKLVNALTIQLALHYGKEVKENGENLGMRLAVPMFDINKLVEEYEVHTRRDEKLNQYIIGVVKR